MPSRIHYTFQFKSTSLVLITRWVQKTKLLNTFKDKSKMHLLEIEKIAAFYETS